MFLFISFYFVLSSAKSFVGADSLDLGTLVKDRGRIVGQPETIKRLSGKLSGS